MEEKVCNECENVCNECTFNEKDILNDTLMSLKKMSDLYNSDISEMSNKSLYKDIFDLYKDTKDLAREAFNILFKKGWYTLEKSPDSKINETIEKFEYQINELE